MKRLFTSLVLIALIISLFAQSPQKMSYQAVIRNSSGQLVANHAVGMRISILQGSATGTAVFIETQKPNTNTNGLATIEIGGGSVVSGTFAGINWASGPYFLKTETDPEGGSSYTISGTSQLLSVPYALHSKTSESVADNSITSVKISDGTISAADLGANAIITEKLNSGAVTGAKIAQAGATSGQALKWNGTTWAPAADNDGGLTLPYSGTATSGSPIFNIVNLGTSGAISTLSNGNYGIWGESANSSGMGVYGVNKTSTGTTYGVFGDVYSAVGFSGYFQGGKFYVQGNTGIGTQNPSAKLEVSGQVKISGGSPGVGKVLTSDAAGLASWQTIESNPWLKNGSNLYYSSGNVGIGLNNPTGMLEVYGNSIDTYPNLLLSEADGYARISFRTMLASSKHWVLAGHTNSSDAVSQWHLNYFNGSSGKNIFSVFGNSNIAFDGNVGIGTQSPAAKLDVAGQIKITGGTPGAGKVLTSDVNGLASWQTPLSSPWQFNGSNIYYTNGRVAIGMNFPRYDLTIYSDNDPHIGFYNSTSGTSGTDGFTISTASTGSPVWIWNWENSNMHFATNNTNRMIIDADGHISMMKYLDLNTDGTFGALYVKGSQALWWDGTYFSWGYGGTYNFFADRVTIGNPADPGTGYMLYVQGTAFATGSWNSSDAGFKKNISTLDNSLEKVMKIRGTRFEFRTNEFNDYHFAEGPQFGFIAQELENIFPELVKTENDGYKSVNYNGMIPVLLESIKEQQLQIESQQKQIDELKQLVKNLLQK